MNTYDATDPRERADFLEKGWEREGNLGRKIPKDKQKPQSWRPGRLLCNVENRGEKSLQQDESNPNFRKNNG